MVKFGDKSNKAKQIKLKIMVSSTVYGIEELLDRVYALLTGFGYEVWMSHKGTMPVFSNQTAFENCLLAVEKCDLFLGIITQKYGSGQDPANPDSLSITHQEIQKAIALKKQRWMLVHDHVVFARTLLRSLGFKDKEGRKKLALKKSPTFEDLRVIDLYEESILESLPLDEREGNWVQKFTSTAEGSLFVSAQFFRYQEVEQFIQENINGNSEGGR